MCTSSVGTTRRPSPQPRSGDNSGSSLHAIRVRPDFGCRLRELAGACLNSLFVPLWLFDEFFVEEESDMVVQFRPLLFPGTIGKTCVEAATGESKITHRVNEAVAVRLRHFFVFNVRGQLPIAAPSPRHDVLNRQVSQPCPPLLQHQQLRRRAGRGSDDRVHLVGFEVLRYVLFALWACAGGRRLEWSSIKPFSRLSTNCRAPELGTSWHLKPVAFFWCRSNCTAGTCRSHSRQVVQDTTYTAQPFALDGHRRNRPPSTD